MSRILIPRFDLVDPEQFDRRKTAPMRFVLLVHMYEEIYREDFGMTEDEAFGAAVWWTREIMNR